MFPDIAFINLERLIVIMQMDHGQFLYRHGFSVKQLSEFLRQMVTRVYACFEWLNQGATKLDSGVPSNGF
jgi:hypothetical protein